MKNLTELKKEILEEFGQYATSNNPKTGVMNHHDISLLQLFINDKIDQISEETYKAIVPEDSDYYCNMQTECPALDNIKTNYKKFKEE